MKSRVFRQWLADPSIPLPESLTQEARDYVDPIEQRLKEEEAKLEAEKRERVIRSARWPFWLWGKRHWVWHTLLWRRRIR